MYVVLNLYLSMKIILEKIQTFFFDMVGAEVKTIQVAQIKHPYRTPSCLLLVGTANCEPQIKAVCNFYSQMAKHKTKVPLHIVRVEAIFFSLGFLYSSVVTRLFWTDTSDNSYIALLLVLVSTI